MFSFSHFLKSVFLFPFFCRMRFDIYLVSSGKEREREGERGKERKGNTEKESLSIFLNNSIRRILYIISFLKNWKPRFYGTCHNNSCIRVPIWTFQFQAQNSCRALLHSVFAEETSVPFLPGAPPRGRRTKNCALLAILTLTVVSLH